MPYVLYGIYIYIYGMCYIQYCVCISSRGNMLQTCTSICFPLIDSLMSLVACNVHLYSLKVSFDLNNSEYRDWSTKYYCKTSVSLIQFNIISPVSNSWLSTSLRSSPGPSSSWREEGSGITRDPNQTVCPPPLLLHQQAQKLHYHTYNDTQTTCLVT